MNGLERWCLFLSGIWNTRFEGWSTGPSCVGTQPGKTGCKSLEWHIRSTPISGGNSLRWWGIQMESGRIGYKHIFSRLSGCVNRKNRTGKGWIKLCSGSSRNYCICHDKTGKRQSIPRCRRWQDRRIKTKCSTGNAFGIVILPILSEIGCSNASIYATRWQRKSRQKLTDRGIWYIQCRWYWFCDDLKLNLFLQKNIVSKPVGALFWH